MNQFEKESLLTALVTKMEGIETSCEVLIEVVTEAVKEARQIEANPLSMPWLRPELKGWSIAAMNHYGTGFDRYLYVCMKKYDYCIKAEGLDTPEIWNSLVKESIRVETNEKLG